MSTFEAVQKWKNDIDSKVQLPKSDKPIPVVLLANKVDLAKDEFAQIREQMDKFCKDHGFVGWFETSAKDNTGIDNAAQLLVKSILEHDVSSDDVKSEGIKLADDEPQPTNDKECRC